MADFPQSPEHGFTRLFFAVPRTRSDDRLHRVSVTATSEQAARELLSGHYVFSFAGRLPAQSQSAKVILPHVPRLSEDVQSCLDPLLLMLYRERRELLVSFKKSLNAAGIAYEEGIDHE